jgi:hypothetical protein
MRRHVRLLVPALLIGVSAPASAQMDAPAAPAGVYGGAGLRGGAGERLSGEVAVSHIMGDAETGERPEAARPPATGHFSAFSGSLRFAAQSDAVEVETSGGSSLRYDQQRQAFRNIDHNAAARLAFGFGARRATRLTLNQRVEYSASNLYRLFPSMGGTAEPVEPIATSPTGYATTTPPSVGYETSAGFEQPLSQRGSLQLRGSLRNTAFPSGEQQDMRSHTLGGGYHLGLTRYATLALDYTYREARYAGAEAGGGATAGDRNRVVHDLNLGLDYTRPLSRSRRTFVSASAGSTIVERGAAADTATAGFERSRYEVTGRASLRHLLGRTWEARLDYRRGLEFVEAFSEPFTSHGLTGTVAGLATRRLDIAATAGAARGFVGAPSLLDNEVTSYMGSATARLALSRFAGIYGSYVYYHYDMGQGVTRPAGAAPRVSQQAVHVGMALWAPLMGR